MPASLLSRSANRPTHSSTAPLPAAVLGAYPHVVQMVEYYCGRPIIYSFGNYLFDQLGATNHLRLQADFDLQAGMW